MNPYWPETKRRLTDDDRRRMQEYAEEYQRLFGPENIADVDENTEQRSEG